MHQKLVNLGEQLDYNIDTEQVDLCRCLFKLHFQLLLLLECFVKLVRLILQSAQKNPDLKDISKEVLDKRNELLKVTHSRIAISTPIEGIYVYFIAHLSSFYLNFIEHNWSLLEPGIKCQECWKHLVKLWNQTQIVFQLDLMKARYFFFLQNLGKDVRFALFSFSLSNFSSKILLSPLFSTGKLFNLIWGLM